MTEQLPQSIQKIRELTPKLNHSIDQANRVVVAVEKFLNDENAGIPTGIRAFDGNSRQLYLECLRIGDKFRIGVSEHLPAHDASGDPITSPMGELQFEERSRRAWSECNRADKLATFKALPQLINRLADSIDEHLKKTDETVKIVDSVMTALAESRSNPNYPVPLIVHHIVLEWMCGKGNDDESECYVDRQSGTEILISKTAKGNVQEKRMKEDPVRYLQIQKVEGVEYTDRTTKQPLPLDEVEREKQKRGRKWFREQGISVTFK